MPDFVDDLLKPSADRRAIAPTVDDFERLLQQQDRPLRGPVFRLTVGVLIECRHMLHPRADQAPKQHARTRDGFVQ